MPHPVDTLQRLLRQFVRPAREDEGAEGLVVEPYRGFGNGRELHFMGRVYRQPAGDERAGDLRVGLRRLLRRGAAGCSLTACWGSARQRVVTDSRGYFRVHLELPEPPAAEQLWVPVTVVLDLPSGGVTQARAEVLVAPQAARFVVISDIDDTVMFTGVAQKLRMLWRLFARDATSRVAFPGVAALYRALHGAEQNPMLYVSRAPWSIYPMLETFFRHHGIPVGPVLFLRDWGLSPTRWIPRRDPDHKLLLIRDMLALYERLPVVLIGDSGQHDPEIYAQIVDENPGRIVAVYIRNVSRDLPRLQAIETLAQRVLAAGSRLLLAADSVAMAEDAAAHGLVDPAAVPAVLGERRDAVGDAPARPVRVVHPEKDADAPSVSSGDLARALDAPDDEPANAVVEPPEERRQQP